MTNLPDDSGRSVSCWASTVSVKTAASWSYRNTGDPDKTTAAARTTRDWILEAQDRGAGEVVLNCMDKDGVRDGYDIEQLKMARAICQVPLIASGGAGKAEDFLDVFCSAAVDGALAASVFHNGLIEIPILKAFLEQNGVEIRN